MPERFFTVADAEAMLPELERTFEEIARLQKTLEGHMDQIKILDAMWGPALREPGNPDRDDFITERAAVRRSLRQLERIVEERIVSRGIRFPQGGLEHGLVDFPTRFEGRTVYLCWRKGEPEIVAWHEVEGGYAGRVPLTPEQAALMSGDP